VAPLINALALAARRRRRRGRHCSPAKSQSPAHSPSTPPSTATRGDPRLLAAGAVDEIEPNDRGRQPSPAWRTGSPPPGSCRRQRSVTVRDDDTTALHWAVFGARPDDPRVSGGGGPRHLLRAQDDAPLVKLLLAHHAPVDARDGSKDTALHRAAMYDAYAAVQALLAAGADRRLRNRDGKTAYELARERHNSVVPLLKP
jgi:hypothetical protein